MSATWDSINAFATLAVGGGGGGGSTSTGAVTPGSVATSSTLGGGHYNSSPLTLTSGQQAAIQLDASANQKINISAGFGTTLTTALFAKIADGINAVAIKAASTAVVAADPALVVQVSPNTPPIPITYSDVTQKAIAVSTQNLNPTSGAMTTNSGLTFSALNGASTVSIQITGTWTCVGGLIPQISIDGTNWVNFGPVDLINCNTNAYSGTIPSGATGAWQGNISGFNAFRLVANGAMTGSATVSAEITSSTGIISLGSPIPPGTNTIGNVNQTLATTGFTKVTDGTNAAAVKAASTVAVAADPAMVVSLSPNNPAKIWDGTNTAAVKAASTAAVAADPALVVSLSPNSPANAQQIKNTQVVDVASAAITTTTTTAGFTPGWGVSYVIHIAVTAVSGTTPSMVVNVQESPDGGVNWYTVYTFDAITTTGSYVSPQIVMVGTQVRYIQTITGTTPSFTRAVNRIQSNVIPQVFGGLNSGGISNGTIASGGTAQALLPANPARMGLEIQNNSAGDLWFNVGATNAAANVGIKVASGATYTSPNRFVERGAITIFGATTAQAFAYRER